VEWHGVIMEWSDCGVAWSNHEWSNHGVFME